MRTTALFLATALALTAAPVRAEAVAPKQRGFLSGLGLGLLIGGLAGVGGMASSNDAYLKLGAYTGVVSVDEATSVTALQERLAAGATLAGVGFVLGGLALAGGIACLILDAPPARVAFVPTAQGGVFVFSGHF